MPSTTAHIRVIAFLHTYQRDRGRPVTMDIEIPGRGISARALAEEIGLEPDLVEGLFLNNRNTDLESIVYPGDRVAFVPPGTPASHPAFFGPFVSRTWPVS